MFQRCSNPVAEVGTTMAKGDAYRHLGRGAKLAYALASLRADPVQCPACRMGVDPLQLEAHRTRCTGREWAGVADTLGWIDSAALRAAGVSRSLLLKWARRENGPVRRCQVEGRWLYSRADITAALTRLVAWHRVRVAARQRRNGRRRWHRHSDTKAQRRVKR